MRELANLPTVSLTTFRLWLSSRPSTYAPVFVIGAPRSGTSLLKNILVANPRLFGCARESVGLFRIRAIETFSIEEIPDRMMRDLVKGSRDLTHLFERIGTAINYCTQNDTSTLLDKVNITYWRLLYLRHFFPLSRFVNIVRDGRDCYCSAKQHPHIPQSHSVKTFAKYWNKCALLPEKWIPCTKLTTIRYEDLVTRPAETISEVMRFLEIEYTSDQILSEQYARSSSLHMFSYHDNLERPITASSIGKWKNEMSEPELIQFNSLARQALRKFDYKDIFPAD